MLLWAALGAGAKWLALRLETMNRSLA
jgi:hypothetical protein